MPFSVLNKLDDLGWLYQLTITTALKITIFSEKAL